MNFRLPWFRHTPRVPCPPAIIPQPIPAGPFSMAGNTHAGKVRDGNEDACYYDPSRGLAIVADGLGGHAAGERASMLACEVIHERLTPERLEGIFAGDEKAVQVELSSCLRQANRSLRTQSTTHYRLSGMGSTVVVALLDGYILHVANLGDSRAYLVRDGHAQQLTSDHSVAAELLEAGMLDEAQARHHPCRNQLTTCLGTPLPFPPAYTRMMTRLDDRVVLCSDGLWEMLADKEIARICMEAGGASEAADRLICAANDAGGHDNITVIVMLIC